MNTEEGWYPDPAHLTERYWTGDSWTNRVRPASKRWSEWDEFDQKYVRKHVTSGPESRDELKLKYDSPNPVLNVLESPSSYVFRSLTILVVTLVIGGLVLTTKGPLNVTTSIGALILIAALSQISGLVISSISLHNFPGKKQFTPDIVRLIIVSQLILFALLYLAISSMH